MKKPRIRIINHRAGDETSSELNMPWERRQALNDALAHLKRACGIVPDSVATINQVMATKRALGIMRQEVDVVLKLLLETKSAKDNLFRETYRGYELEEIVYTGRIQVTKNGNKIWRAKTIASAKAMIDNWLDRKISPVGQ